MDEPTVTVSIRLPQDLKKGLDEICKMTDLTLSQLVRMWARGAVKEAEAARSKAEAEKLPEMAEKPLQQPQMQAKKKRWK